MDARRSARDRGSAGHRRDTLGRRRVGRGRERGRRRAHDLLVLGGALVVAAASELEGGAAGCWLLAPRTPVVSGAAGLFDHLRGAYLVASGAIVGVIVVGGATLLVRGEREHPRASAEPYAGEIEARGRTIFRVVGGLVAASAISAACCVLMLIF